MRLVTLPSIRVDDSDGVDIDFVAELTDASRARVQVAHFSAGDTLAKHSAGMWQIFAVVSGHGFVAGDDDVRCLVEHATAAVWEPGEQHTSWATTDLVVVIVQSAHEPHILQL
jgi:uncharacterized protein (DUF779 family)